MRRMLQLETSLLLTLGYCNTILEEILFASSSSSSSSPSDITVFQRIQSSFPLERSYNAIFSALIVFILLAILLIKKHRHGIFVVYITLLKFFESLSILFDLMNILLIYEYKIKHVNNQYSWIRFYLTLILIFIRLILSFDNIRRKYANYQSKRRIIVIFDLLYFILINITLLRDSTYNIIRLERKIILGTLIFHLNYLFSNEHYWFDTIERNDHHQLLSTKQDNSKSYMIIILHIILYLRWIVSLTILCLFGSYRLQSAFIISQHENFSFKEFLFNYFQSNSLIYIFYIILIYLISWDAIQNRNALNKYGIEQFSTGVDLHSKKSVENMEQEICSICFNEKKHLYFNIQFSSTCEHVNRNVCDNCLFQYVQQRIQITFTDDISCPEQNCSVIFDFDTVRNILLLGGDQHLIERYNQYIVHRQLEQMKEFIWCTNPLCHAGQLHEDGQSNMIVICYNCQQKTCFQHKIQWHEGMTCEEYDEFNDPKYELNREWIMKNSKKCPGCSYRIEKNQGCDHMTCRKCRYEFCWLCLADFQPIRQYGNDRHNITCKYYTSHDNRS